MADVPFSNLETETNLITFQWTLAFDRKDSGFRTEGAELELPDEDYSQTFQEGNQPTESTFLPKLTG